MVASFLQSRILTYLAWGTHETLWKPCHSVGVVQEALSLMSWMTSQWRQNTIDRKINWWCSSVCKGNLSTKNQEVEDLGLMRPGKGELFEQLGFYYAETQWMRRWQHFQSSNEQEWAFQFPKEILSQGRSDRWEWHGHPRAGNPSSTRLSVFCCRCLSEPFACFHQPSWKVLENIRQDHEDGLLQKPVFLHIKTATSFVLKHTPEFEIVPSTSFNNATFFLQDQEGLRLRACSEGGGWVRIR